jgi:DNA-binding beta-propeller fold protein YncE
MKLAWLCVLSLTGCGLKLVDPCKGRSGTCLALQVENGGGVDRLATLSVVLDGGLSATKDIPLGGVQRLPLAVAIVFDSLPEASVQLSITADGSTPGGMAASGMTSASLTEGAHQTAHVRLTSASAMPDLALLDGAAQDLPGRDLEQTPGVDLAGSDLAGVDLFEPPDFAATPIVIAPSGAQVGVGEQRHFTANLPVTWSVMEAAAGTIDGATGQFTAGATPGTYHVVATRAAAPNDSAALAVNVIARQLINLAGSSFGTMDGSGGGAQFSYLVGVDHDAAGDIYVADLSACEIRHVFRASQVVQRVAGQPASCGEVDGDALTMAKFMQPTGLALDRAAALAYTVENSGASGKLRVVDLTAKQVSTPALGDTLNAPAGVCYDGAGHLFVAESGANRARRVDIADWSVHALPGTAGSTTFTQMKGIACDPANNLIYVSGWDNAINRIDVNSGAVTLVAGGNMGSFDATGALATFNKPEGLALDDSGFLYVADTSNCLVRKIELSSQKVSTLAGNTTATCSANTMVAGGPLPGTLSLNGGIGWLPSGEVVVASSLQVVVIEGP